MPFRVLIIGGTGQVGGAVVRALAAQPSCVEIVMVNRRALPPEFSQIPKVRPVILDMGATDTFPAAVAQLAQSLIAQGDPVYGASCIGVGKGSSSWTEEQLLALEIGVAGGFARGCREGGIERFALLSAVGSTPDSRVRYVRVMGRKEETIRAIGFRRLAIFRPGIITGNANTPGVLAWLGNLIPGKFGTIHQDDIARAFAAEFLNSDPPAGVVYLENSDMKRASAAAQA